MNEELKLKIGDYIRFKKICGPRFNNYTFGKDVKNTVGKILDISDKYNNIQVNILNNKWFDKRFTYNFSKDKLNSNIIEILSGKPSTILYLSNKHFYHRKNS